MKTLATTFTVDGVPIGPIEDERQTGESGTDFVTRHIDHVRAWIEANYPDADIDNFTTTPSD